MSPENKNLPKLETDEPTVGFSAFPVWMVVLCGALFYWCQMFLDGHAGGFNKEVYAPYGSLELLAAAQPQDQSAKYLAIGQQVFNQTCAACHQPNGLGKEGQYPPLAGSDWVMAPGPNRLGRIVLDGVTGPITVAGKKYDFGTSAMTPFRGVSIYTDESLGAAISYVRKTFGNGASLVTADQIKAIRAETASHANHNWTPEELLKVTP
jgi:mono/diheme cytochrome c family protein